MSRVLKFSPLPAEESEYSVFTTANPRSVEAPALWFRDRVAKKACAVDDRRVVKDAGSFGDSTLTRFFPLVEEDETLLKVLEIDTEVVEYLRYTYKVDWDPAKPLVRNRTRPPRKLNDSPNRWSGHQLSLRVSPSTCREPKGSSLQRFLIRRSTQPCSQVCLLNLCPSAW